MRIEEHTYQHNLALYPMAQGDEVDAPPRVFEEDWCVTHKANSYFGVPPKANSGREANKTLTEDTCKCIIKKHPEDSNGARERHKRTYLYENISDAEFNTEAHAKDKFSEANLPWIRPHVPHSYNVNVINLVEGLCPSELHSLRFNITGADIANAGADLNASSHFKNDGFNFNYNMIKSEAARPQNVPVFNEVAFNIGYEALVAEAERLWSEARLTTLKHVPQQQRALMKRDYAKSLHAATKDLQQRIDRQGQSNTATLAADAGNMVDAVRPAQEVAATQEAKASQIFNELTQSIKYKQNGRDGNNTRAYFNGVEFPVVYTPLVKHAQFLWVIEEARQKNILHMDQTRINDIKRQYATALQVRSKELDERMDASLGISNKAVFEQPKGGKDHGSTEQENEAQHVLKELQQSLEIVGYQNMVETHPELQAATDSNA